MSGYSFFKALPNLITVGRLFLVPIVVAMISSHAWGAAFAFFVVAGVSDAADGFIAKRYSLTSELGAHLDPIADKALLVSIYVSLAIEGELPSWITILVVSRDLMIVGAILISWVLDKPVEIRPLLVSKLNTFMQIVLAMAVMAMRAFDLRLDIVLPALVVTAAALTLASMVAYLAQWLRHMSA